MKFEAERNRPIVDLLGRIPTPDVRSAVDIGCGPGNSTEALRDRYPHADIIGIDSSPDMIAAARKRLPALRFEIDDIATWRDPGPFDLILSNAVLHWVPDHERLMPALCARLREGGCLAVQMPDNLEEPAHSLMRDIAADGPWAAKLAGASRARTDVRDANYYYGLLRGRVAAIDIWRTTYFHPLAGGAAAVAEWFKGSGLLPFLAPLDPAEREMFLARYEEALAGAYPELEDGAVLLPFPRLFMVVTR
jgi:trans-aconitate 2-methyltransferase